MIWKVRSEAANWARVRDIAARFGIACSVDAVILTVVRRCETSREYSGIDRIERLCPRRERDAGK